MSSLSSAPVSVVVRAWVEQGLLQLSVANSGVAAAGAPRDGAFGLANTRERLRALYGAAATLQLSPVVGGGSQLRMQLPAMR